MNTNHSSLIRGLYIAITVLAALSLVSCVVGVASMNLAEKYLYDALEQEYYDTTYDYLYDLDDYWDDWYDDDGYWHDGDDWGYDHDYSRPHHSSLALQPVRGYGYESSSVPSFASSYATADLILSIINGLLIWEIVVSVVALLVGIIGLVNAGKPAKLHQLMGISIAGAVVSFLGGHIILVALFIIAAVMANKDKYALLNAAPPAPSTFPQ